MTVTCVTPGPGAEPGRTLFLILLSCTGNVSLSAQSAGLSRQLVCHWRDTDRLFADSWASAEAQFSDQLRYAVFSAALRAGASRSSIRARKLVSGCCIQTRFCYICCSLLTPTAAQQPARKARLNMTSCLHKSRHRWRHLAQTLARATPRSPEHQTAPQTGQTAPRTDDIAGILRRAADKQT